MKKKYFWQSTYKSEICLNSISGKVLNKASICKPTRLDKKYKSQKQNSQHKNCFNILKTINSYLNDKQLLKPNSCILLSISGGQDSICLFFLFEILRIQWNWKISIIYCNHLWQKESFETQKQICKIGYYFNNTIYFTTIPGQTTAWPVVSINPNSVCVGFEIYFLKLLNHKKLIYYREVAGSNKFTNWTENNVLVIKNLLTSSKHINKFFQQLLFFMKVLLQPKFSPKLVALNFHLNSPNQKFDNKSKNIIFGNKRKSIIPKIISSQKYYSFFFCRPFLFFKKEKLKRICFLANPRFVGSCNKSKNIIFCRINKIIDINLDLVNCKKYLFHNFHFKNKKNFVLIIQKFIKNRNYSHPILNKQNFKFALNFDSKPWKFSIIPKNFLPISYASETELPVQIYKYKYLIYLDRKPSERLSTSNKFLGVNFHFIINKRCFCDNWIDKLLIIVSVILEYELTKFTLTPTNRDKIDKRDKDYCTLLPNRKHWNLSYYERTYFQHILHLVFTNGDFQTNQEILNLQKQLTTSSLVKSVIATKLRNFKSDLYFQDYLLIINFFVISKKCQKLKNKTGNQQITLPVISYQQILNRMGLKYGNNLLLTNCQIKSWLQFVINLKNRFFLLTNLRFENYKSLKYYFFVLNIKILRPEKSIFFRCSIPILDSNCRRHSTYFTEQKARNWRYELWQKLSIFYKYTFLVTGHTATDRAETLLLNLIRGSGKRGVTSLQWNKKIRNLFSCFLEKKQENIFKTQFLGYKKHFNVKYGYRCVFITSLKNENFRKLQFDFHQRDNLHKYIFSGQQINLPAISYQQILNLMVFKYGYDLLLTACQKNCWKHRLQQKSTYLRSATPIINCQISLLESKSQCTVPNNCEKDLSNYRSDKASSLYKFINMNQIYTTYLIDQNRKFTYIYKKFISSQ